MKLFHLKTKTLQIPVVFYLLFAIFSCQTANNKVQITNSPEILIPGDWQFSGHIGEYIDKVSEHRILDEHNWNVIYSETEEAFRLREDDKNYPKNGQWRGEFWGKYLLSVIAATRYYHSDELKTRVAGAVEGLLSTQESNGYIGTYVHSDFVIGNTWNVWDQKYTLWGLVEAWELLDDDSILTAAKQFADHLITEVGPETVDIVKTGNFYGLPSSSILKPMVKLYKATGDQKYLEYSGYIVKQWAKQPNGVPDIVNKGLSGKPVHDWFSDVDPYQWGKGYEFTSCVEGLLELYEVTGTEDYFTAAKNIHAMLVEWERTPVGSVSFNDKYVGSAAIINTVSEICDAVYWNRLSYELFMLTGDEKYIDEIERTLYNSLLCAMNTEGTWGLRRLRMSHIHIPAMCHFLEHHQCCTDNLPRGLFQAAETALMANGSKVYLSLFSEGKGSIELPSQQKVTIENTGDFLTSSTVHSTISLNKSEEFQLMIRMPRWSKQTIVKVNGVEQKNELSNQWLAIHRKWNNSDEIEIIFDLAARWETFDTTKAATLHNPIDFYNDEWAKMKYSEVNGKEVNPIYSNVTNLPLEEALPQKPAVTFFYGPLALSRDVRLTEGDIFAPVHFQEKNQVVSIKSIEAPKQIWKAFELDLGEGQQIRFCDFSSAGNTWDFDSKFNTWCILYE